MSYVCELTFERLKWGLVFFCSRQTISNECIHLFSNTHIGLCLLQIVCGIVVLYVGIEFECCICAASSFRLINFNLFLMNVHLKEYTNNIRYNRLTALPSETICFGGFWVLARSKYELPFECSG